MDQSDTRRQRSRTTRQRANKRLTIWGELNSPVVERRNKRSMANSQLWHFFGVRKYLGGELNSPVVERRNKGLMAAWSPT
eukprot:506058-Pyramimonas_sp.AAC.1